MRMCANAALIFSGLAHVVTATAHQSSVVTVSSKLSVDKMTKRQCPFDAHLMPQLKVHISDRENISPEHVERIYDRTLQLLFKGAKLAQTENCEMDGTNSPSITDQHSNVPAHNRLKQMTLSNLLRLQKKYPPKEEREINDCICSGCSKLSGSSVVKCEFCEKKLCSQCIKICVKCEEIFCTHCTIAQYIEHANEQQACHSCYGHMGGS